VIERGIEGAGGEDRGSGLRFRALAAANVFIACFTVVFSVNEFIV
jgi:hypothetical protein